MRKFKHLSFSDRLKIEALCKAGVSPREIADIVHTHISTIYRELKRGQFEHLNMDYTTEIRYSPDIAQQKYKTNLKAKGGPLKIGSDYALAEYIEEKIINEKYSPAAVLGEIKAQGKNFNTTICTRTLYSYIDKGIFLNLTNKDLLFKGKRKRPYKKVKQARAPRGESIENRPSEINERSTFGHWEMDTVIGQRGSKPVLLVLSERLTRNEIIIPIKDKSAASVVKGLDNLEKRYGQAFSVIFKTITVDNGSEFADCAGIERSRTGKGKRTKVYYCHPYSSYERGTNENINRMIRRRYPKGTSFSKVTKAAIQKLEDWINNYPRGIFEYHSSAELFKKQLSTVL